MRAAAAAYAGFQPSTGGLPRQPAVGRARKIANQAAYTSFELTVAAAVCAIAAVGTGKLLDLNVISFAEFILADAFDSYQFHKKTNKTVVNPCILQNSIYYPDPANVDSASPETINYLKTRPFKSMTGNVISTVGLLVSPHTLGANVLGGAKHGASTATTLGHMGMLAKIGKEFWHDHKTREWIRCCEAMKTRKAITRGAWTASNTVPGAGLIGTIIAMVAPLGGDMINQVYCHTVAAEIHHAAKCGSGRQKASARAIIEELLTRRGPTRLFGKYEVDSIIQEPAGWMVVANKLTMV